jgi:antitoxin component of MazEF toxin-antitoxin module
MKTALRRMGNSLGVILPKPIIADAAIQTGDALDVTVEEAWSCSTSFGPPIGPVL